MTRFLYTAPSRVSLKNQAINNEMNQRLLLPSVREIQFGSQLSQKLNIPEKNYTFICSLNWVTHAKPTSRNIKKIKKVLCERCEGSFARVPVTC